MAQPRPILYVHHRGELSGAPMSLAYLIRELDRERFEPHVYTPTGPAVELFRDAGAIVHVGRVAGFTHIWASTYRGRRWLLLFRELLLLPSHVRRFRQVLDAEPWSVVHLNDSPLVAAAWLARRRGIPTVWHLRSSLPPDQPGLRTTWLRRTIRRLAQRSIAINRDVADSFDVGSTVIPNPVDLERFSPGDPVEARRALGLPEDRPLVAFFGYLYPSKGFEEFIHAAAALRDRGIEATYVMVGGAVRSEAYFRKPRGRLLLFLDLARNYEREAKALVDELGLADAFHFVPFTRDTPPYYRAADVVVTPSRGPEVGRPAIEGAASGVCVIASGSRTGSGIVLPGETGLIVDSGNASSIADAVEEVLEGDRRGLMGRAARAHAETMFDPVRNARLVEGLYDDILGPPGPTQVLFVHHRPQLGGAPTSLAALIEKLDERFEPHVYTPAGPAAELFAGVGATVHTGPSSIFGHTWDNPYQGLRWLVFARELLQLPGHARGLASLLRRHRFPIVHVNDSPLLAAAAVAKRHRAKVVWHVRSALYAEGLDRRSRIICRLMERWGDAVVAIDDDVAERFRVRLPLTIIHNTMPMPESNSAGSDEAKRRLGLPQDRICIGFAGFVRHQKGWPQLVEAAALLVAEGLPVQFVIMGGGVRPPSFFRTARGRMLAATGILRDEETAIRSLVEARGLTERFSFLEFTRDVTGIYCALDVITFPNQGVGLGRPVIEAAAHGKPAVASGSRNGAGVLLPGETGLLLADPSPPQIAAALRRLVVDGELRERLGAAASAHAREAFDPARSARAVEEVYDALLSPEDHQFPKMSAGTTNGSSANSRSAQP
jgi:glycosyltransferase involved in cell wall biosynthesis